MSLLEHLMSQPLIPTWQITSGLPRIFHIKSLDGASKHCSVSYLMICHRPKNRMENTYSKSLLLRRPKREKEKSSMCSVSQLGAYQLRDPELLGKRGAYKESESSCLSLLLSSRLPAPRGSIRSHGSKPHSETPKLQEEAERPKKLLANAAAPPSPSANILHLASSSKC